MMLRGTEQEQAEETAQVSRSPLVLMCAGIRQLVLEPWLFYMVPLG